MDLGERAPAWTLNRPPMDEPVLDNVLRRGTHLFDRPVDAAAAADLLADLRAERRYDESLFLERGRVRRRSAIPRGQSAPGTQPAGKIRGQAGVRGAGAGRSSRRSPRCSAPTMS